MIADAAGKMWDQDIGFLPVIDEDRYVLGVISMNDIVRESARELGRTERDVSSEEFVESLASVCKPRHRALGADEEDSV